MSPHSTPTTLPQEVVEKLNKALGKPGKPYLVLEAPSPINNWAPASIGTGGFSWRLEPDMTGMGLEFAKKLERVRPLLVDESVAVYIGADCECVPKFSCLMDNRSI